MKQVILIATIILGMCSYGFRNSQYGIGLDRNPEKSLRRIDRSGEGAERSGKASLAAIIDREADLNQIPRSILRGLISIESGFKRDAVRYESGLCNRKRWTTDQRKCVSAGHGQIVWGFHNKDEDGAYQYYELFEDEPNIMLTGHLLRTKLQGCGWSPYKRITKEQLNCALGRYNGDATGTYAARVLREAKRFEG